MFFSKKKPIEQPKQVMLPLKSLLRVLKYGEEIGLPVKESIGYENDRTIKLEYQNVHYYLHQWADWTMTITLVDKSTKEELTVYNAPHGLQVDWNKDIIGFKYNATSFVKWDVEGSWSKIITETILDLEKEIENKKLQLQKESEEKKQRDEAQKISIIQGKAKRFEENFFKK
ncbi:hypothetical protein [Paenibacillus tianjinensis]|uniref:Uncharacterized protein n=1 Tax=Paenibacillus tianjinensis TaxID=2810347 RepID=A0ABX7LEJ6_9BACL|nr:hypothetical protein [Paenibacillus tianjinensis]QSF46539.1 hypothetical protein JRJ22_08185 [Paenibacillus tianjinensis]